MLRLVKGKSKSGKTEYIRNFLSALALSGESKLLCIVPDQQSFETEKAFLSLLGPQLVSRVKVLGFSRLCDYVFETVNYSHGVLADDPTKAVIMSIALEDVADSMQIYGEKALSPQLLTMMLSVRKELVRNSVDPTNICEDTTAGELLSKKLSDISLVMSAFDAYLNTSFADPDCELKIACDLLKKHKLFKDYIVCVDSYLSFTQPELDILQQLMLTCREVLVTLSDEESDDENSIFSISRKTAATVKACAKNNDITIGADVWCDYEGYFVSPDLSHIEKNAFRNKPVSKGVTDKNAVNIYCATNRYDEADYVARNIRQLVMEQGLRYSDIAVVSRGTSQYNGILDAALERYDISYFADSPSNVLSKPLMKLISAIFKCVTASFHSEDVLAVLKSGVTCVDYVDASLFENYLFTWSLSGSRLLSEFTANPSGFSDEFTTDDLFVLSKVENIRRQIVEPIRAFRDAVVGATAAEISQQLYELLITLGVDSQIKSLCDDFDAMGEHQLSKEQLRLWEIFIETLDCMHSVIGERTLSARRYAELLELQFASREIAFIPRCLDQVTVGDIERLRLYDKKAVFVIGAVEGEFPLESGSNGLFTPSERDFLSNLGILSDTSCEYENIREQYLCYYALTSASQKLFVSYPGASLTGSPVTPSVLVTKLVALFDDIMPTSSQLVPDADKLWAHKPSFNILANRFASGDNLTLALKEYYSNNEKYIDSVCALERASKREPFAIKDESNAKNLFGENMNLSASQVEKFHLCRFMYFCNYGLRIRERRVAKIDAMEYGTFVHYILENFIKKYPKLQLLTLSENEIKNEIDSLMQTYADLHLGGMEDKSSRFRYLYLRVGDSAKILIEHLIAELSQSEFTPTAYELSIGSDVPAYKLTLPTGQTVTIRGMVDRADVFTKDNKTYLRIVDYKTGSKVFNLGDVMYGLNLQMLIYLSALCKDSSDFFGSPVVPAGVLYMPAIAPVIDAAFDTPLEKIAKERNDKLRMNGILLYDDTVLEAMEKDLSGIYIPVSAKGDDYKGADNLATLQEFGAIFSHIDSLICEMAQELHRGKVEATPAKCTYDACAYCPYSSICAHKDTDKVRDIYKLDREEILTHLGISDDTQEVTS